MNTPNQNPDDTNLSRVLRSARPEPALPPRFQEAVWRRIADAEKPARAGSFRLEAFLAFILRPRFALVTASVMIMAGALLGVREASQTARADAQSRYVAAVAPSALH